MRASLPVVCAAVALVPYVSFAVHQNKANNSSLPPEYEIREMNAPSGAKYYGVKCRTETPRCTYDWNSLCRLGAARDAKRSGTVASAPTYVRAADGLFMRLFVCMPIEGPNEPLQPIAREDARSG